MSRPRNTGSDWLSAQRIFNDGLEHKLIVALRIELEKERAEIARLTELHRRVRSSLQTELERGAITDTLWMNDNLSETIFDALDHALKPDTGEKSREQ